MRLTFTFLSFLLLLSFAHGQKKTASAGSSLKKACSNCHGKKGTGASNIASGFATSDAKSPAVITSADGSPNITGIWKGHFVQDNLGYFEDRYRFEVQIAQQPDNSLESVTYSYKTTVFYGKAEANGIYTTKTSNVVLKENKLVDLKITEANSGACLMTCYLEYAKVGKLETLTGTYTSVNMKDKNSDCGSGKVYLEKVETSDFYKEDFVAKRENELKKKARPSVAKKAITPKASTSVTINRPVAKRAPAKPAARPSYKPTTKPKAEDNSTDDLNNTPTPPPAVVVKPKKNDLPSAPLPPVVKAMPKPDVIRNRENDLVKTITTSEKEFKIDLYDNGEIDGDRISVYHNNELIVSNQMLTDKPISFTIKCDEENAVHEFVMVADNLGSIPPNTALMIITAGSKRYELTISSTEQKNAVVRIQYQPE